MKFVDVAEIKIKAGDGGLGMSHFRREKFIPFGGPDGGNGGPGGSIVIEGSSNLSTLLDFRYRRFHEAECGGRGGTNDRQGKTGEDLILKVPPGTIIMDGENEEIIGEILSDSQRITVAKGGTGGMGNSNFASSRNQAPTRTIPPTPGEQRVISLELKMMADVGIIGSPNAGKSTLVTVISAARPKVADYPFTTLTPTLGVVSHKDAPPFVVADVPGLIPGASSGKGLGLEFLRHIERTRVLIHLIDGSQADAKSMIKDFEGLLAELELFNPELLTRPRLTAISKLDILLDENTESEETSSEPLVEFKDYLRGRDVNFVEISSAHRTGIKGLLDKIVEILAQGKQG